MEFLVLCDVCGAKHSTEDCPVLELPSSAASSSSRARLTVPHYASVYDHADGQVSVVATSTIPARTRLGPYEAKKVISCTNTQTRFPLKLFTKDGSCVTLETDDEEECNWLTLIQPASSFTAQNLMALQIGMDIFYTAIRDILPGEKLCVWYAPFYARKLEQPSLPGKPPQEVTFVIKSESTEAESQQGYSAISADEAGSNNAAHGDSPSSFHQALEVLTQPRNIRIKHRVNDQGLHTCSRCNKQFEDLQDLACHVKEHLIESDSERGRKTLKRRVAEEKQASSHTSSGVKNDTLESDDGVNITSLSQRPESPEEFITTVEPQIKKKKNLKQQSSHLQDEVSADEEISINSEVKKSKPRRHKAMSQQKQTKRASSKYIKREPVNECTQDIRRSSRSRAKLFSVKKVLGIKNKDSKSKIKSLYDEIPEWSNTDEPPDKTKKKKKVGRKPGSGRKSKLKAGSNTQTLDVDPSHIKDKLQEDKADAAEDQTVNGCDVMVQGSMDEPNISTFTIHLPSTVDEANHEKHALSELTEDLNEPKQSTSEPLCELANEALTKLPCSQEETVGESPNPALDKFPTKREVALDNVESAEDVSMTELGGDNGGEGTFTCKECEKVFTREIYLQRHMECHRTSYNCSSCKKSFGRKTSLLRHHCSVEQGKIDEESSQGGPYFCEFCGAKFFVEKYLARHMATHTGEFSCRKCSRVYARKQSLLAHLKKCDPDQLKERGMTAYVCEVCNRAFSKELSLKNHMSLHSGKFNCKTCGKSFTSSVSMNRHKCGGVSVLESSEPICCDYCPQKFKSEYFLQRHMAKHKGTFSCPTCNRSYITIKEFKKHILECQAQTQAGESGQVVCGVCDSVIDGPQAFRKHFEQHTHPYHCQKCGKGFMRRANLQNHSCKEEEGPVNCPICQKEFRLPKYLQNHMLVHEEKKYQCDHCNKAFRQLTQYNKHLCIDPNGKPAFIFRLENNTVRFYEHDNTHICQLCGKNFTTVSNLNKHIKCHGEKKETCDICNKKFHLKIQVTLHKKMVHTKVNQYECQYCHKFMKSRNSLYGHIATYHGEIVRLFQCKECGKKFRHKGNLKKHMLLHSDKKLYSCNQCSKTFKYPEQRRRHELWHEHGHRFKCALCARTFLMEFELKRHINSFHGGVIYSCRYCNTECHHPHTMKRHLQRRHMNMAAEWETDTVAFLKSITRENPDVLKQAVVTDGGGIIEERYSTESASQDIQTLATKETLEDPSAAVSSATLDPSLLENLSMMNDAAPLIVAEVQGMNGQDVSSTQTVIIQTMGDQITEENLVSEEVALALRNLGMQGFMVEGVEDQAACDVITTVPNDMMTAQTNDMGQITLVPIAGDDQTQLAVQLE